MITKEEALNLYYKLFLIRRSEEKIGEEYFNDEMKTPVHLGIGGEAIPVGVCHCLPQESKVLGTYRNHAMYLTKTSDIDGFFGELYGKITGRCKGKAGSMHLTYPEKGVIATSAVVGTTIPVAVGVALSNSYRHSKEMVAVFFGDGATEEGTFWESLNFACLRKLRIIFICEDNELAIHTHTKERQGFSKLRKVVSEFDCHTEENLGSDVFKVIESTRKILKKIEETPKPGVLHLSYFRFLEHVGPLEDFKFGYRDKPDEDLLKKMDPVYRFEQQASEFDITSAELANIRDEINTQIKRSVLEAQQADFPDASELLTDVLI